MPNPTPLELVRKELAGDRFRAIVHLTARYAFWAFLILGALVVMIGVTFFICDTLLYPIIRGWAVALFFVTNASVITGVLLAVAKETSS